MAVRLSVRDLKPGMILADPVVGKDGQESLPAGTKLTARHIAPLKTREVQSVMIDDDEGGIDPDRAGEIRRLAIKHVEARIRWKPCNPIEDEICQVAIEQEERLLQEKMKE